MIDAGIYVPQMGDRDFYGTPLYYGAAPDIGVHAVSYTHLDVYKRQHLLRADVDLHYIRDFLGYVQIETTEVYARADAEMKRKALETANL